MKQTIEVKHKVPTTVHTTEVNLPFYFTAGKYVTQYCCMNEDGNLVTISKNGGYWNIQVTPNDDADEIANCLEREFCDPMFAAIDEALFHHKFSEAHREIFYMVNPQLKPVV